MSAAPIPLVSAATLASTGGSSSSGFVVSLLVVLGAAAVVSVFLKRLRLTAIPGYLIVGAMIGATGMFRPGAEGTDGVREISDLAIVLLMFTIGMHMDVDSIRFGMVRILAVGALSTVAVALVLWPAGMILGLTAPAALVVAMAFAMSSTAVVLGILQSRREVHRVHGRLCVGISLTQDLMSIGVLALMPPIAIWSHGHMAGAASETLSGSGGLPDWAEKVSQGLLAIGGIVLMTWFGRVVLPRILREAGREGNTEALLVVSAAAALAAAVLTNVLGFGSALGAFLAGFLLSSTPFRHQLAGQLSPMRDLFMAVFFTAVGVQIDLGVAATYIWLIAIALVIVLAVKFSIISVGCWLGGASAPVAALTGALLWQAGEFSLVVVQEAESQGIISPEAQSIIIGVVVVSLIATAPVSDLIRPRLGLLARVRPALGFITPSLHEPVEHVARAAGHATPPDQAPGAPGAHAGEEPGGADPATDRHRPPHVIIAGFGIVGRNLAEHLGAYGMDYTIVDMNPHTIERQRSLGRNAVFGDISNPDVLESAGISGSDAVVLTIPDDDATLRSCRAIRERRPDVFIAARTTYLNQAITATELGADHVTIEEVVTAQDIATKVIAQLGKRLAKPGIPHL